MQELNQFIQFKQEVRRAIENYKKSKNKIPVHRQKDIKAIEEILNKPLQSITETAKAIRKKWKKFHTGFWFLSTKKSTLKKELKGAVHPYLNHKKNEQLLEIQLQVEKELLFANKSPKFLTLTKECKNGY